MGLASLQDGMTIRVSQTRMLSIVRPYVLEVSENEGKPDVGEAVVAALNSVYKTCNNDAARKIRAHVHNDFLLWVKALDDKGELERLLSNDPWNMQPAEVNSTTADLRETVKSLSDVTKYHRSVRWRNTMRQILTGLARRQPTDKV